MATGSTGYFAMSKEATAGVEVTTPDAFYPVEQVSITAESDSIDIKEIRGSRQAYSTQPGAIHPQVTFKGAIYPHTVMAYILEGLLGKKGTSAVVSPSTTAYKHPFQDAPILPTFTIERATAFSDDAGAFQFCQRVAGAKVETFSVDLSFGKLIEFNVQMQAQGKPNSGATPVARAVAEAGFPTVSPMYFGGATITVGGTPVSIFENLKIEIDNTLARQDVLNGVNTSYKISEGGVQCKLSGSMIFEDSSYYTKWENATDFAVVAKLNNQEKADAANNVYYGLNFTWDTVEVSKVNTDWSAGEVIKADVEFRIKYNQANARSVLIEMINLDDGTTY